VFEGTLEPKTGIIQGLRGFPRGREKLRPRRARSPRQFLAHRYSVKLRPVREGLQEIARLPPLFFADFTGASMKAKIIITPKKAVLDPQGKTVQTALAQMGHTGIKAVHVGKYLEIELEGNDVEAARKSLNDAAHQFLSNPVIEDYQLEIQ
jgi:phosphoribosylformylglycinamidine synthase PurS subunit